MCWHHSSQSSSTGYYQSDAVAETAFFTALLKEGPVPRKVNRPISNLTILSNTTTCRWLTRSTVSMNGSCCLNYNQHTAPIIPRKSLLRILSDIFKALDRDDSAALTLLDCRLRSTPSITRHSSSNAWKHHTYGIDGVVLSWLLRTYNNDYNMFAVETLTSPLSITMLGPRRIRPWTDLFLLYVADLIRVIVKNGLHPHLYAGYTHRQLCGLCSPAGVLRLYLIEGLSVSVCVCVS